MERYLELCEETPLYEEGCTDYQSVKNLKEFIHQPTNIVDIGGFIVGDVLQHWVDTAHLKMPLGNRHQ